MFQIVDLSSENEMFREDDNEERRKPVSHAQKEGVKDGSEMISSSDSSNDVNDDTHEGPQESRDLDCPISENLSRQSELIGSVCRRGFEYLPNSCWGYCLQRWKGPKVRGRTFQTLQQEQEQRQEGLQRSHDRMRQPSPG